ncbi:MAG TPA: LUD domain-containing protein [Candidatus Saccharimonadales bacterium]|nr:LUD domain-containing protein [Candidatus Saccharimonadales bacterium]
MSDHDAARNAEAREAVLGRIRVALADRPASPPVPRDYERALPATVSITDLFAQRVGDYRAEVQRSSAVGLPATLAAVLARRRVRRLATPTDVPPSWLAAADVERVTDDPPLTFEQLDGVDGVITGCAVAIAETGTVILDAGPAQGRRAISLLPDVHICVVMANQVVGTVTEALERLDPTRPQTWISGPSATSDIELHRVEGVHGPRILDVVLVKD